MIIFIFPSHSAAKAACVTAIIIIIRNIITDLCLKSKKIPCKTGDFLVKIQFTECPFAKLHVPCIAANRKQSLLAALFCSFTGIHLVPLIRQIPMQAWNLSESAGTRERF